MSNREEKLLDGQRETLRQSTSRNVESQGFFSQASDISLFENTSREPELVEDNHQNLKPSFVSCCEVCDAKTRFTRAVMSCCADRCLCIRCYEHFLSLHSSENQTCPFCKNSKVKVSKRVEGLFSPFSSQNEASMSLRSNGFYGESFDPDDGTSI